MFSLKCLSCEKEVILSKEKLNNYFSHYGYSMRGIAPKTDEIEIYNVLDGEYGVICSCGQHLFSDQ